MKKIKDYFWITFAIALFGCLIYKIAMNSFTDHFLGSNPQHIKAIIIYEKNYMGNRSGRFSYSYMFGINGKTYKGNSHNSSLQPGDTVEVIYNEEHPDINKPLHPKE
ncbi:MAG: hypothetical protein V4592_04645 [Bacteroidota bacterium]